MRILPLLLVSACGFELAPGGATGGDGNGGGGGGIDGPVTVDTPATADAPQDAARDAFVPDAYVPMWVPLETIIVPVNGTTVMSTNLLANGVGYRLRASGTFVIQSGPGTLGDAEWWDFANPQDGVAGVDCGLAVNDTVVDVNRTPDWGAYKASHVYEVPWTGNGQRIVAQLHDGNFTNNTGSLMLTILAYQ